MCDVSQILMSDRRRVFDGSTSILTTHTIQWIRKGKEILWKQRAKHQEWMLRHITRRKIPKTSIKQVNANKLIFNFLRFSRLLSFTHILCYDNHHHVVAVANIFSRWFRRFVSVCAFESAVSVNAVHFSLRKDRATKYLWYFWERGILAGSSSPSSHRVHPITADAQYLIYIVKYYFRIK